MGLGGISVWQLLILLVIVLLVFGTKRLKTIGSDLGNAVKGFRSAMSSGEQPEETEPKQMTADAARHPSDATASATAKPDTAQGAGQSRS